MAISLRKMSSDEMKQRGGLNYIPSKEENMRLDAREGRLEGTRWAG